MTQPIPILLFVRELGIGGCERDLVKLACHIDRHRFTPHAGCFKEGFHTRELRDAGVPVAVFPVASFLDASLLKGALRLRAYVRRHGIRILHGFDVPGSLFAAFAGRCSGASRIVTSMLGSRDLVNSRERSMLRLSDRLAHRIMVNSEATGRQLIEDDSIPPRKLFVNHNGYDPAVFHPPAERPPTGETVIGIVCALRPEKNIPLLIEAFRRVHRPGVRLFIVGSGPLLPELERQVADAGLTADCHFEPARPDVAPWFRKIDIFVLPSVSESFPNALLEAMASGCACVATRVGGIPELIEDNRSGLLFANGDAGALAAHLDRLLKDTALRRQLGTAAAARARAEFPVNAYCRRMEALYDTLLTSQRAQRLRQM